VHVSKGENRTQEYLSISPSGKVPAYVEGDFVLTESAAIINYLLKKFGCEEKLSPAASNMKQRAKYEQWLLFTVGHLDPTLVPALNHVHHTPRENQDSAYIYSGWRRTASVPFFFPLILFAPLCFSRLFSLPRTPFPRPPLFLNVYDASSSFFVDAEVMLAHKRREFEEICLPAIDRALPEFGSGYINGDTFSAADIVVTYSLRMAKVLGWLEGHKNVLNYFTRVASRPAYLKVFY
jgi:glutathione S-transferase